MEPALKISKRDRYWFRYAHKLAVESNCKQKHAAVAVLGGRVVGASANRRTGDPKPTEKVCSVHAEKAALRNVPPRSTVYVVRVRSNGEFGYSKPCELCQKELVEKRAHKVFWTGDNDQFHLSPVKDLCVE